jgi:hypothetical protein
VNAHVRFWFQRNAASIDRDIDTGELDLQQSKKGATRLFRLAVAGRPKDFIEYEGANAELKALGAAQ